MARNHRSRQQPKIEQLRWSGATFTFAAIAAGSITALNFITSATERDSLMRMRGQLVSWLDGVQTAASVANDVALGAILAAEGSATAAVAAPAADDNAPWFLYERWVLGYEEYVVDVIDAPGASVFRKEIDLKAMRIFRPDVEAQLVHQTTDLVGTSLVNTVLSIRALFGQH